MAFLNLWRLIGVKREHFHSVFCDSVTVEYWVLYSGTGLTRYLKIDN